MGVINKWTVWPERKLFSFSEYLKYAPCMREVAPQNNICFTRFSTEMKQIQEKSETQNNFSNPTELITYQKRKREAADEGIRSVCWWVVIFNFTV